MFQEILEQIKKYDTIIIHGHIRPDGDCYGSQFGLQRIIQANFPEKKVYVVGQTSDFVSFVGAPDIIDDSVYEGALAIVVDTGAFDRISDPRVSKAEYMIKIDHHIAVGEYGDIAHVDTDSPSCSQIIAQFALYHKLIINEAAAFALYTGIVTDTGRFRYRGVDKNTMMIAGELLDRGVDIEQLDNYLSVETLETVKLKGYVLNQFKTTPDGVAYIEMTRDIIEEYHVTDEEAAAQVNLIGSIEGHPVWCLIIEYPAEIRIRIRSRGPNVDQLANRYNGGGHAKAAGAKLFSWDQLDGFLTDINALVKEYKEQ